MPNKIIQSIRIQYIDLDELSGYIVLEPTDNNQVFIFENGVEGEIVIIRNESNSYTVVFYSQGGTGSTFTISPNCSMTVLMRSAWSFIHLADGRDCI